MIAAVIREACIQALLLALRFMTPVTAVGAVVVLIGFYTMAGAACFYAAAWLVSAAMNLLTTPA